MCHRAIRGDPGDPSEFWETVLLTIKAAPGTRAIVERDAAAALTKADPRIAFTFGTFDQMVEATVTQERLIALLSGFFGGLALLLAAMGLYGLVAHTVRARQWRLDCAWHWARPRPASCVSFSGASAC